MPTTPIVIVGSVELQLKFLTAKTPPSPLPNFDPLLTKSMLGATTISTPLVIIHAPSD
jgi:hypothetical protein